MPPEKKTWLSIISSATGGVAFYMNEFKWPVAAEGYRWVESREAVPPMSDQASPVLVCQTASPSIAPAKWYAPLREKPALFRTFADTPATPEGILGFVRKYGMLGGSAVVKT